MFLYIFIAWFVIYLVCSNYIYIIKGYFMDFHTEDYYSSSWRISGLSNKAGLVGSCLAISFAIVALAVDANADEHRGQFLEQNLAHEGVRGKYPCQQREDGSAIDDPKGSNASYRFREIYQKDGQTEDHDGYKRWHRDGKLHREDGPAIEGPDGYKAWWRDGRLHREDGPAVEDPDGYKVWYREGKLHREDGPAIEGPNGKYEWWRDGVRYLTIPGISIPGLAP